MGGSRRGFKCWAIKGVIAAAAAATTYLGSHRCGLIDPAMASACLTIGSGVAWAISASLPDRRRALAIKLNRLAACLAAMSGVCLMP